MMLDPRFPLKRLTLALASTALLSGCAVGPDFFRPDAQLPEQYGHETATTPAASAEAAAPDTAAVAPAPINPEWWRLFEDSTLDSLIAETLANNQDLQAAIARMQAAEAAAREAGSYRFPSVDLNGSVTRNHTSGDAFANKNTGSSTFNDRQAGLGINYEIDLWGRVRRSIEAADASALSSQFARDALRLSLTGQVAAEYLTLRSLDAQLQVTRETLESREQTLKIVQGRFDAGASSALDLAQARGALSAAQAQWNDLRRQRALSENLLGLLTGHPGLTVRVTEFGKLPMPPMPPVGLPSGLIEARPDVRQSEQDLIAANARIGVAKAAYFPSISLTGLLGSQSTSLSDLFGSGTTFWTYGATLAMPIFDAGRTGARVDQASAYQKEALANYRKTLQIAFREVKDALVALKELSDQEIALAAQVESAQLALKIAQANYEGGYISFMDVLDSLRTVNAAQLQYLTTHRNRLSAAVDLFKALGGGWQPETLTE